MSWRYMAARQTGPTVIGEESWTIREVYDGTGWSESDVAPSGSTHQELLEDLRRMAIDIEHRDFLDLDTGQVAHPAAQPRPGGSLVDIDTPCELLQEGTDA